MPPHDPRAFARPVGVAPRGGRGLVVAALAGVAVFGAASAVCLVLAGLWYENACRETRRELEVRHDLGDLRRKAFDTDWEALARRAAPHAPPAVRRTLAQDLKFEYQDKYWAANKKVEAEYEDWRVAFKTDLWILLLLAFAAAAAVGGGVGVGAWFLVNSRHGPPRRAGWDS